MYMSNGGQFSDYRAVPFVKTKNRSISSSIPAPGTYEYFDKVSHVESRSMHGQIPIVWSSAKNFSVFDIAGNKFIDFTSGIFVTNVGHSNKSVSNAIKRTLASDLYSCYSYLNSSRVEYLEALIEFSGYPFEKAFLMSAGTEATEGALKLMRMHGQRIGKRRRGIVCLENNWHGRTLGAQLMSSNPSQGSWIGYRDENIHHIKFPYPWDCDASDAEAFFHKELTKLEEKNIDFDLDLCGVMLETFQGWGAIFYPPQFVQLVSEFCKKHNLLLCFDEMQSGFARTGLKFGFQHYEVEPDLICVGKGMGGGVPLSGVLGRSLIMDLPEIGNMSSTHSANPLVCAAGQAVLTEIDRLDLVNGARVKGELMHAALSNIQKIQPDIVSGVYGKGLIGSILFKNSVTGDPDARLASAVVERCMQKGLLLVHTGRESIKLGPPLTISKTALLEGLDVLSESIGELM